MVVVVERTGKEVSDSQYSPFWIRRFMRDKQAFPLVRDAKRIVRVCVQAVDHLLVKKQRFPSILECVKEKGQTLFSHDKLNTGRPFNPGIERGVQNAADFSEQGVYPRPSGRTPDADVELVNRTQKG